ncbi:MAG: phosphohydrolase [Candidatus Buchananbacteria bacterium RBG_13_36_9]|uniref:Phosphohydrolase n=1 Tax=Candidatus Buchananbacteria bacterium RBG_13_36_9 TaxID=1797530 RepID=A0A1G1XLQ1_9BACT|nr:MAG: phosphohydrolase [Candidatus Buchananbacteria bacterium RBG_13_36_9]
MDRQKIIDKTKEYVKSKQQGDATGHDWWHTYRVWQLAVKIGQIEQADLFIIELAALLHDLEDWKITENQDKDQTKKLLVELGVEANIIEDIVQIIKDLSFKGAGVATPMKSIEGKIVQDADRLDAIGAIGIARAFAYGGYKSREIYNPEIKPILHDSFEQYKNAVSTTINHFYEKLFLLKDLMNTETAKAMAEQRHEYMEKFVQEFFKEWDNK